MGVPEDQLPETKTPPKDLQQYSCESTANEIHKVLAIAKKLSETLDEDDA
jgi:hypothetical protein